VTVISSGVRETAFKSQRTTDNAEHQFFIPMRVSVTACGPVLFHFQALHVVVGRSAAVASRKNSLNQA
jgi:hypothetical protein